MSARNRAAPWFLERPQVHRRPTFDLRLALKGIEPESVRAWLDEVELILHGAIARQWSWDGITWFDARGAVVHQGTDAEYGGGLRELAEREAIEHYAEMLGNWADVLS